MKLEFSEEAEAELQGMSRQQARTIRNALNELVANPAGHEKTKLIRIGERTLYTFRIREGGRGGVIDHRAVFDIKDGAVRVYSIFPRDTGYRKGELAGRLEQLLASYEAS